MMNLLLCPVAIKQVGIQYCKSGTEKLASELLASGLYEQICSIPKVFKRDFKFNPSHVLSQYRRVNFTLRELIVAHTVVLLCKIHFRLNLQCSPSLFFSALPILRPTKGNLVYISQHSVCFHLWHKLNNLYKCHVTSSATPLTFQSNHSWSAVPSAQLTAKSVTPLLIKAHFPW